MFSIAEQFSSATKSQLASQLKIFSSLASTAVASAEQVIALNLSTTKASLEKSSGTAKQLLQAKDPQEFIKLSTSPSASASLESLLAYGSELFSIASKAQADLFRAANEQVKDTPLAPVLKLAAPAPAAEPKVAKAPAKAKPVEVVAEAAPVEVVAAPVEVVAAPVEVVAAPVEVVAAPAPAPVAEVVKPVVEAAKPAPLKSVPASKKQK